MRLSSLLLTISLGTLGTAAPAIDTVDIPHHVARDGWDWFWCTKKMIDQCIVLCRADQRHYVACRGPVCNCTRKPGGGGGGGKKAPKDDEVVEIKNNEASA